MKIMQLRIIKKLRSSSPNNYLKEISKLSRVKNHYNLPIPVPFLIGNMCFDLSKVYTYLN